MKELNIKVTKATKEEHEKRDWAWAWKFTFKVRYEDGYTIYVPPNFSMDTIVEVYKKHVNSL